MPKSKNPHDLTDLQIRFCHEFIKDLNGTRAYIRAGYNVKSTDSARAAAARTLANVSIQAYLGDIANLSEVSIIAEVIKLAFAEITDVIEYENSQLRVKPSREWSIRAKAAVKSISVTETIMKDKTCVTTQVVMHDKLAALEKLLRKFKMYPRDIPLLDAVQLLFTEGVATPEQSTIIAEGIAAIEQRLKTVNSEQ